jgi:hypothetical protein
MASSVTPKKWALLAVAVATLAVGGYLIARNYMDSGQPAPSGAPRASTSTQSSNAPATDTARPAPTNAGPRRVAPK